MSGDHTRKIHPNLRGPAARARISTQKEKKDGTAHVFVEVSDAPTLRQLETLSRELEKESGEKRWLKYFVHLIEGYCTLTVREDHLDELARMPGVAEIEAVQYPRPMLNESVPSIHGWEGIAEKERVNQGAGVLVGIVDYGLDFSLDDFRNPGDRSTRVAALWDQDLDPKDGGEPPPKFGYGVEYSREQIDAELRQEAGRVPVRHDPLNKEANISGHGTHVAGIAAGNGTSDAGGYVGVAPGATLVFVNLPRHTIVDHVSMPLGTLANSVNLAHAIVYCFKKAEELKMPCVVNLSMGFNGGGHDGNMIIEWIIDALLGKAGRAVVIAAGNEHEAYKRIYCRGKVPADGATDIKWDTGRLDRPDDDTVFVLGDPSVNEVEIWYSSQSKLEVRLVAPGDNQACGPLKPDDQVGPYPFDGGEKAIITSDQQAPWGGAARIHISLIPGGRHDWIRYGTWLIQLRATQVSGPEAKLGGVRFDAWIERTIPEPGADHKELWSRFQNYDRETAITLTTPGTARRAITVASCKNSDPVEASDFSSRGPTRDERRKPEIAAPGHPWITSSGAGARPGNEIPVRAQRWGTSMAAPHVAGVIARLLGRHNYLLAEEIRSLLIESARPPDGQEGWDRNWGYGKVDAAAAMALLEKRLET